MGSIHVLAGGRNGVYQVVIHTTTPAGNNSAGVSWATAIVNSGRNKTILPTGNGPGQITSAEAAQITAGTVIETVMQWQDDPTFTNQQRIDDINLRAGQLQTETLARFGAELKFFGYSA